MKNNPNGEQLSAPDLDFCMKNNTSGEQMSAALREVRNVLSPREYMSEVAEEVSNVLSRGRVRRVSTRGIRVVVSGRGARPRAWRPSRFPLHSCQLYSVHRAIVGDWNYEGQQTQDLGSGNKFLSDAIDQGAREYAMCAVERLFVENEASTLPLTTAPFPIMFLHPIMKKSIEWMNNFIKLRKRRRPAMTERLFYRLLAVVFCSHACSLSLSKSIETLRRLGHDPPCLTDVRYLMTNMLPFPATKPQSGSDAAMMWQSHRDKTTHLSDIKSSAFGKVAHTSSLFMHFRPSLSTTNLLAFAQVTIRRST